MNNRPNRRRGQGPLMGLVIIGVWLVVLITLFGLMGSVIYTFDVVNHFRPVWIVYLALAVALFAIRKIRRKRIRYVAIFGLIVNLVFVAMPLVHWLTGAGAVDKPTWVISQLNAGNSNADPDAVLSFVQHNPSDVLLLQDVSNQSQELLKILGAQFPHRFDCAETTGCHLAMFSRYPLTGKRIWHRSEKDLQGWSVPALSAQISIPDMDPSPVVVVTHLARPTSSSLLTRQLNELQSLIAEIGTQSTVLAGDFNLTPWAFAHSQLSRRINMDWAANLTPTWPAPRNNSALSYAVLPLNHFYVSRNYAQKQVLVGEAIGSDHYPLVLRIGGR